MTKSPGKSRTAKRGAGGKEQGESGHTGRSQLVKPAVASRAATKPPVSKPAEPPPPQPPPSAPASSRSITGRVVTVGTETGLSALRVQSWARDEKQSILLGESITNAEGGFDFTFEDPQFQDPSKKVPDLFFRIYRGEELIKSTEASPIRDNRSKRVQAQIEIEAAPRGPKNKRPMLAGRIINAQTQEGWKNLDVDVWLKAPGIQKRLGTDKTDGHGHFKIEGDEARLAGLASEVLASLFFGLSHKGEPLACEEREVASVVEMHTLVISVEAVPGSRPGGSPAPTSGTKTPGGSKDEPPGHGGGHGPDSDDEDTYTVLGQVRGANGKPLAGALVLVFDRDLRSEELLGEARTCLCGFYEVRYTPDQFKRAEKRWADLVVRAWGEAADPVATSPIQFNAPASIIVDLLAGGGVYRGPSEHERLIRELTPLLDGVALPMLTDEDLAFLSGETGRPGEQLKQARTAVKLSVETEIAPEAHYAFLRRSLPEDLRALLKSDEAALTRAIDEAIEQNLVPASVRTGLPGIIARIKVLRAQLGLDETSNPDTPAPRVIVGMALPSPELQQRFMAMYTSHEGDVASFWEKVRADPELAREDQVDALQTILRVGLLTQNHPPMVNHLIAGFASGQLPGTDQPLRTLADLARLDRDTWVRIIQQSVGDTPVGVPPTTPGETPEERIARYAEAVAGTIEAAFPTTVVAHHIERDAPEGASDLSTFLSANPSFDIKTSSLQVYLAENPGALDTVQDKESTARRLGGLQRLMRLTGRYDAARALLDEGLDSARLISRLPERDFVARYGAALGGELAAERIHRRARQTAAAAVQLISRFGLGEGGTAPAAAVSSGSRAGLALARSGGARALARKGPAGLSAAAVEAALPDLRMLFGEISQCACKHCRSVLSPAAYLVDLLNLLKFRMNQLPGGEYASMLEPLTARRPDLVQLELSCENTNTPLPYIDIVNEILESAVVQASLPEVPEGTPPPVPAFPPRERQTRKTTEELTAHPAYLDPAAYAVLRTARFPWGLPFDLWWEEVRLYFEHLGLQRETLMRTFQRTRMEGGTQVQEPTPLDIATERLGLTPEERVLFTMPGDTAAAWGMPELDLSLLREVPKLLERSGLGFDALEELLRLDFLKSRAEGPLRIVVDPEKAASPRDLQSLIVEGLTVGVLDGLHRFVRLSRKLGWTFQELHRALLLLGAEDISDNLIQELAALVEFASELGMSPARAMDLLDGANDRRSETLARALGIGAPELTTLAALLGASPMTVNRPGPLLEWVQRARRLRQAPLSLAELAWLCLNEVDRSGRLSPRREQVAAVLGTLRQDLAGLAEELTLPSSSSRDELLRRLERAIEPARAAEADSFLERDPIDTPENRALVRLYFPFLEAETAFAALLPTVPAPDEETRLARRQAATTFVLAGVLAHLRRTLGERAVKQRLGEALGLEAATADLLLGSVLQSLGNPTLPAVADFLALHGAGASARYTNTATPDAPAVTRLEAAIDFDWGSAAPDASLPAGGFTADFTGRLWAPRPETWTFVVRTSGGIRLEVAGEVLIDAPDNTAPGEFVSPPLPAGGTEKPLDVKLTFRANDAERSFLRLEWSSPSTPRAVVPRGAFFSPALDVAQMFRAYERLVKAALVARAFRLSARELRHLSAHGSDFGGFDLNMLPLSGDAPAPALVTALERVHALTCLRARLPEGDRNLIDLFALAGTSTSRVELLALVHTITGWSRPEFELLCGEEGFGFEPADFRDERALLRLEQAIQLSTRLGLGADPLQRWGRTSPDQAQAEEIRATLQSKRGPAAWLTAEKPLRDRLRERQRTALASWLVARPQSVPGAAWRDMNGLYHHYLIDVEMSHCQLTSRVNQAIGTVQLFIQRGLMNLEPGISFSDEDARQWNTWMKSYRVWEANRKVFLYPENWLRAELRRDKTPFFKELEQQLNQEELTDSTAEAALSDYVRRLDSVSRLRVVGTFHEAESGRSVLHIFARTDGTPHEYFYRTRLNASQWTAWEKVDLDIEGDHLIPVVAHRRLYLFWPIFENKAAETAVPSREENGSKPELYAEIRLAWATYENGRWLPKKVSTLPLKSAPGLSLLSADYVFKPRFDAAGDVVIECHAREAR